MVPDPSTQRRQRLIRILLVVTVFFGAFAIYSRATAPPKYQPQYHTIAQQFLDLHAKYESIPDESYQLLDDVINEVKSRTHYDPSIKDPEAKKKQFLQIFCTIDSVLIEKNFIFPPGRWTATLGEALEDHWLSSSEMEAALAHKHNARRVWHMKEHADEPFHLIACGPNAFLYMGVAQVLGFELKAVYLPKHIFVRAYIDPNHWVNWDGNRGLSISDEVYAHDWGVEDWQIQRKIFLSPLTDDQVLADMYSSIGCDLGDCAAIRGFAAPTECNRKALALNPDDLYANNNLAGDLMFQFNPSQADRAEALKLCHHVLELQPNDGEFHETMAFVYATNGQTESAVAEMNKAIALEPDNQDFRDMLPLIASGHTMYGAFQAQNPITFWIGYQYGWLVILIGVAAGIIYLVFRILRRYLRAKPAVVSPPIFPASAAMT